MPGRHSPSLATAQVVPDNVCPVEVGRIQQGDNVSDRLLSPVLAPLGRTGGGCIAPLARNQGTQARDVESFCDSLEPARLLRESVQQHDHLGV